MKFPEEYPILLQNVSWEMNQMIGILPRWNKYCKVNKDNPYFFQNLLKQYVSRHYFNMGNLPKEVLNIIKYICNCISIKYISQQQQFIVSFKKIKQNQKYVNKFKEDQYKNLYQAALLSKDEANKFLKNCILFLKNEYNHLIQNCQKNKNIEKNVFLQ